MASGTIKDYLWQIIVGTVSAVLTQQWHQATTLHELTRMVRGRIPTVIDAQIARDAEALEAAHVVRIERSSAMLHFYYVTGPGRDWALDHLRVGPV